MNLIGPKSIASKLHLVVKAAFFLAIPGVLLMSIVPFLTLPNGLSMLRYVSFDVRSGPLYVSFDMLRGSEARWWIWAIELVSRTYHAVVLYLLMRILEPVGAGVPFHPKTPSRLRIIGGAVVISSLLRTYFCAALLNWGTLNEPGVHFSWAIDFDAIFMGIVLVVLAEVFGRGYVLKTESELTV
jgi:hypothetical protein